MKNKYQTSAQQIEKHAEMTLFLIKTVFQKVDIFMVKVGISWSRSLKPKNECRIRIQQVKKHTKITFLEKKFFFKFDEKMRWAAPLIIVPLYVY